ncbi:DUF6115 domain-containing protein [Syntrophothermus lipocalidus]|uniref:Uncharacterized protein n=1 Tax=Syntrophothermus lipocalidus (strain DSM 12680 / TGB-C1) TaxID=643648 RepID=D7CM29_SYNLT|nr:hypothetical protein [Syntrophothermus lipocalidus]ADI01764.1 hypothetical protein Slip_0985 [Syntrophothermus lipocalidus DSM 12680]
MSWLILMVTAVALIVTALYSVLQQDRFVKEFTSEMRDVLDEAVLVKKDLEAAMENAVLLSRNLAQSLDERIKRAEIVNGAGKEHHADKAKAGRTPLPFSIEDLRRAHPYLVVPRLKEQGLTVQEIAEVLGRGQGEVQLILDLHRRKEACS